MIIDPEANVEPRPERSLDQEFASAAATIRENARRMLLISGAYLSADPAL